MKKQIKIPAISRYQVVKALECCLGDSYEYCKKCPIYCGDVKEYALYLIKALIAENEKLKAGYHKNRKGEWMWDKKHSNYKCSLCKEYDITTPKFCRECGAKMSIGEKNEKND